MGNLYHSRYPIADNEYDFKENRKTIEQLGSSLDDFDARFQAIYKKIHQKLSEKLITSTVNQWKADDMKKKEDDMKKMGQRER